MSERIIIPFSDLSQSQALEVAKKTSSWKGVVLDGKNSNELAQFSDPKYASHVHVAVFDPEKGYLFDKVDSQFKPAVFVTVYRKNTEKNKFEFLLPTEQRILIGRAIRNIPQGLLKENESAEDAARREVAEEVGKDLKIINLTHLGDHYNDIANSSTAMPSFLAEVEFKVQTYEQDLESEEEIKVSEDDWFSLEDEEMLKLQCKKTMAGLFLASGYLGLWNTITPKTD